jgi:hypothetical protein
MTFFLKGSKSQFLARKDPHDPILYIGVSKTVGG